MKHLKILALLILVIALAACAAPAEEIAPVEEASAGESKAEAGEESMESAVISDPAALVGVWRGRPAGGILEIDENLQTTFAQNLEDLLGNRDDPTFYKGSIRFEGSTVYFEDSRCQNEGPGTYEVHKNGEDGIVFVQVSDECSFRVNNLLGQRVEPQIDVTWFLLSSE